jgi:hypothetical protein
MYLKRGKVPELGSLFRSSKREKNRTRLLRKLPALELSYKGVAI